MTDRLYLTIPETADELRVSRATVYRLIQSRAIEAVRVGYLLRVPRVELDRFAARHTNKAAS